MSNSDNKEEVNRFTFAGGFTAEDAVLLPSGPGVASTFGGGVASTFGGGLMATSVVLLTGVAELPCTYRIVHAHNSIAKIVHR